MDFISNKEPQIAEMLSIIGVKSIHELFACIPEKLRLKPPSFDDGLSEYEGLKLMEELAAKNTFASFDNYLGGGAYEHHVPAIVSTICSKSEFLTSYTPYQAEASQGMLQIIFEFQSAICALTGMDVANASVYDGASACAEALLMALRQNKPRKKILIASSLNPRYLAVINQYLNNQAEIDFVPLLPEKMKELLNEQPAALLIQSPNFFGWMEDAASLFQMAKKAGALSILCANPLSYGLYPSAGELGADIAVGDCQPFGIPMQFGGPYCGYMACKKELVRQLPGRIVGETVDMQSRRGFVLTLQAREQHIRREKATSNICTNQALAAMAALIAILWYGKKGLPALAKANYQRACYLRQKLSEIPGVLVDTKRMIFNEFIVQFEQPIDNVIRHFRSFKIEPGLRLGNSLLIAVTETKSKKELDSFINCATTIPHENPI